MNPINPRAIAPDRKFLSLGNMAKGSSQGSKLNVNDNQEVADFFRLQVRGYLELRSRRELDWERAQAAYQNRDRELGDGIPRRLGPFIANGQQDISVGLPFAATSTTVAALVPNKPVFRGKAKNASSRDIAHLGQMVLNNHWLSHERQWQMEKWVRSAKHCGLMIGCVIYETDYDEFEEQVEKAKEEDETLAGLDPETAQMSKLLQMSIDAEERRLERDAMPKRLRGEADHSSKYEEVSTRVISPWDYIADPNADGFVYGPRWEGRRYTLLYKDLVDSTRFDTTAARTVQPQLRSRFGGNNRNFYDRLRSSEYTTRNSAPLDHQMVEVYEIYWYDDPKYKESFGSLITVSLDGSGGVALLERRPNPYGRRVYVVEEWNGDVGELFPQPDINGWFDLWKNFEGIVTRLTDQIDKAPYSTLVMDSSVVSNPDEIASVLMNENGGIALADLNGTGDVNRAVKELATKQVSPEFINAAQYMIELVRIVEGMGPNQFGGAPLKSDTSATEAGEIGNFARARLDIKGNAVQRFLIRMGEAYLHTMFRFTSPMEIAEMVGDEVSRAGIDISKIDTSQIGEVNIEIIPGSMGPDANAERQKKLGIMIDVLTRFPQLQQQLDSDSLLNLLNDITMLETGEKMFVGLDDPRAALNAINQMSQQKQGGSVPGAPPQNQPGLPPQNQGPPQVGA